MIKLQNYANISLYHRILYPQNSHIYHITSHNSAYKNHLSFIFEHTELFSEFT